MLPNEEELQISEFIKDPASLKLLILAGTKIKPSEIATVNKCTSLIKLDLSCNQLISLPLRFANFPALRILYLHDNQLTECQVSNTQLQYITLFGNPLQHYRSDLIEQNPKLLAVDRNVITTTERKTLCGPKAHSSLNWPIVDISQELQHEEDYLNLLKAELFVISQVHKRATYTDTVNCHLATVLQVLHFQQLRNSYTNQTFFRLASVKKAAKQWIWYTQQRKKLKRILAGTSAEYCTLNQIQRVKATRSRGVSEVLQKFLVSIRERMKARRILQRGFRNFRLQIKVFGSLEQMIKADERILYFRQSQDDIVNKLLLYARKLFFNQKDYDICDNFNKLVVRKKSYYIFRFNYAIRNKKESLLQGMIRTSMGLVMSQKGLDRTSLLYNKKGHKKIQIKSVGMPRLELDQQRVKKASQNIHRLYDKYDTLVQMQFKQDRIFSTVFHLLRYFNSGNVERIQQNRAAYFQTEVILEDSSTKVESKIFFSSHSLIKRAFAANVIQRAWRRYKAVKDSESLVRRIRQERAKRLIGRWVRDLRFRHRVQLSKLHSFMHAMAKQTQLYLQIDIYMGFPKTSNLLGYPQDDLQDFYKIIHSKTEVELIQMAGRRWIKIKFNDCHQAASIQKKLSILTYRYYFNGFYIKLFTLSDLSSSKDLEDYERKVEKLFGIKVTSQKQLFSDRIKKTEIDNLQAFFIWPFVQEGFAGMFKPEQVHSLPISVFIYNKNRRPLKVNCDLLWTVPPSLYFNKKAKGQNQVPNRAGTPKKELPTIEQTIELYKMPHMRHRLNRERQFSMKQHKSLLQANRQRGRSELVQLSLLSETLNVKRQ